MDEIWIIAAGLVLFVAFIVPLLIVRIFFRLRTTDDRIRTLTLELEALRRQGVGAAQTAVNPRSPGLIDEPSVSATTAPADSPASRAASLTPASQVERVPLADDNDAHHAIPVTSSRRSMSSSSSSSSAHAGIEGEAPDGRSDDPWQTAVKSVFGKRAGRAASAEGGQGAAGQRGGGRVNNRGEQLFAGLVSWFMRGNPLAKLGIILLFFGLAYLLRESVERGILTIEMRLLGAAVISLGLLAFGWRLRLKQPIFALIVQGGAVGAFYITVFGAFKLYHQLPFTLAFGLMLVICAASVGLAVLQSSLSLAMLASLGGYLAPLLLSTGSGNHLALFSYYLLLSAGILAVSRWQSWRQLNLLGFVFTFGIGGLWGYQHYQPALFVSSELFLLANILLFGLLSVMFGARNLIKGQWAVDGSLLFGAPLLGFGYQYALTRHWEFGPAFSALGFGLFYLLAARIAFTRWPGMGRMLSLSGLVLGVAFATLAIPLALSARWTAMAWTLEGLAMVWLGLNQDQRRLWWSGTAVMLLGAGAAVRAWTLGMTFVSFTTVFVLVSAALMAAGVLWHRQGDKSPRLQPMFSQGFLGLSLVFWLWTLAGVARDLLGLNSAGAMLMLLLMTLSVWLWLLLGSRLQWLLLRQASWLLWPVAVALAALQWLQSGHPLSAGYWALAWPLALVSGMVILKREESRLPVLADHRYPSGLGQALHLAGFWLVLMLIAIELVWQVADLPWGNTAWQFAALAVGLSLPVLAVKWLDNSGRWPLTRHPQLYWQAGLLPLLPGLLWLLAAGNLLDGQLYRWRYLPIINPLEEGALLMLMTLYVWLRNLGPRIQQLLLPKAGILLAVLLAWWLNGVLLRGLAWYGELAWSAEPLWASRLVQTTFALVWTLSALLAMLFANRRGSRPLWFCGIGILAVTIVKLFIIDSASGGGLGRAIAFLGVAVLVLLIGYFVPLPPRQTNGKEPQ
ncbi:DUF2339 domain-containing protein [Biostraticola tofi]|uniref:Putative membrane protein n=1 Tax=Biostraticola tofi TaxID=466109 RepID=A0A4R3Z4E9_9GAMM|nr:DUF2339 domain-containing protein [Biostraticola tofi]TCW00168.1 putative membrane protein [Biostraticola tofi]